MFLVIAYLLAIVLANLSVAYFGEYASIANAFLFIGLNMFCRDSLHEIWGKGLGLWLRMFLLILVGSMLSFLFNRDAGSIAIASFAAFAASGLTDTISYFLLGNHERFVRMNGSNIVSAAVDSAIFAYLAFGALSPLIFLGQWLAKIAGGFIWSVLLNRKGAKNA